MRLAVFLSCVCLVAIPGSKDPGLRPSSLFGARGLQTPGPSSRLTIANGQFQFNGQTLQILSGEMHYPRVPREYWRDRMKKARAMGLNTITTYVFWNLHEPKPGVFDFSGNLDVAAYIRTAQEEGLHVIVRPGPYVCAEWDLGGLPAWLLADRRIVLRSADPKFLAPAERFLKRLGRELAPLQSTRGGPIIAVQVENEYGSFENDKVYMGRIRDAIVASGLNDILLYTADGPSQLPAGTLPDLPAVVNFEPGGARAAFDALRKFRPDGPLMSGEYWAGWFDPWGQRHANTNGEAQARELDWMLDQGGSFNLYMFHGGTTFGFMNGANLDGNREPKLYHPQVSSYDYDSALDESGRPKPKFFLFRDVITKHFSNLTLPELPIAAAPLSVPRFTLTESASLWANLGRPVRSEKLKTMEEVGQSYGYILYRRRIDGPVNGNIVLTALHDYAVVFVDRKRVAALDRRLNQSTTAIEVPAGGATLDILVENTGRINYRADLRNDRKGITDSVTLSGQPLLGWEIYPLPMTDVSSVKYAPATAAGPSFTRGRFDVTTPSDTFLDLRGWEKGTVWVNGHHLGRFWNIGPQQTLYVPGPWLRRGANEIVVFDLADAPSRSIAGLSAPVLTELSTRPR